MAHIEKLVSIGSEALGPSLGAEPGFFHSFALGPELFQMLRRKNGFYAFESALHVFPLSSDPVSGLEGWNAHSLWRAGYQDLAEGLLFFAEDIFQDQFCFSSKQDGVLRFQVEMGQTVFMADSLENWAAAILSDYKSETGWPLVHNWQARNGPLPPGKRLMPKTPFFLGGEFKVENLWAGEPVEGMRFKADLAMQTRNLPDGEQVNLKITQKPE